MGRRAQSPDPGQRRQVEAMAGFGIPEADIARVIGIDGKTLRRHYREELDTGHIEAGARVAENLYRKATGEGREAVTAAIFWLKTRCGWKETSVSEVRHDGCDSIKNLMQQIAERGGSSLMAMPDGGRLQALEDYQSEPFSRKTH